MWWWSNYGPTGWMFFGPMIMLVFTAMLMTGMFFVMRTMHRHRSETAGTSSTGMSGVGVWPSHDRSAAWQTEPPGDGHSAFEKLDEERRQFEGFMAQLRMPEDKAEFDQIMAETRKQPSRP
jgi:hypothetical protein